MKAQIEVSVKVYLYMQVSTNAKDIHRNEEINFCEVYPTWESAERALKCGELKEAEDGIAYKTALGNIYQYHNDYENNKGEHVWEIRRERIVDVDGGTRLEYEACRVIEKKF